MAPVPYVIKEAPYDILIAIDYLLLRPKVPGTKPRKVFKVPHDLHKVSLYLAHVPFWLIPMYPFDNLDPAIQPVNKVRKHDT